jgi:hypothetical protein
LWKLLPVSSGVFVKSKVSTPFGLQILTARKSSVRNKFEIGIGALPNNKNILGVSSQLLSSSKKDMLSGLGSQASPEMSKFNFNALVPGRMIAQPNANLVGFGFPFNG